MELLFKLLIGHAVADFALQSDVMAKGKNRHAFQAVFPGGQKHVPCWPFWLSAHALIHAGIVWLVTGRIECAIAELLLHWMIDFGKCDNWYGPHVDQALHVLCKVGYLI